MPADTVYVLMLENDHDDRYFTQSTIDELNIRIPVRYMPWSEKLPDSLLNDPPSLILLSYNALPQNVIAMLRRFKMHPALLHVPVVILTEDVPESIVRQYYAAGANSLIKKPSTVAATRHKMQTFFNYWFGVAEYA